MIIQVMAFGTYQDLSVSYHTYYYFLKGVQSVLTIDNVLTHLITDNG